jgi:hypothetical protein
MSSKADARQPAVAQPKIRECLRALVRALARSAALQEHEQLLNRDNEHARNAPCCSLRPVQLRQAE